MAALHVAASSSVICLLVGALVGQGNSMASLGKDMDLRAYSGLSQSSCKEKRIFHRNRSVGEGVPEKYRRHLAAHLLFQRQKIEKLLSLLPLPASEKDIKRTSVGILSGGDHRIAQKQAVRAQEQGNFFKAALGKYRFPSSETVASGILHLAFNKSCQKFLIPEHCQAGSQMSAC